MKKQNFENYIVFILGTDNFEICKKIREIASREGMDNIYENCIYIAKKFNEYDKNKYNYYSQYESLRRFLNDYNKEINEYLDKGIKFNMKGE